MSDIVEVIRDSARSTPTSAPGTTRLEAQNCCQEPGLQIPGTKGGGVMRSLLIGVLVATTGLASSTLEESPARFHIPADPEFLVVSLSFLGESLPFPRVTELFADGRIVVSMGEARREATLSYAELTDVLNALLDLGFAEFDSASTRELYNEAEKRRLTQPEIAEISESTLITLSLNLDRYRRDEKEVAQFRKTVSWRDPLWTAKMHPEIEELQRLGAAIRLIGKLRINPDLVQVE